MRILKTVKYISTGILIFSLFQLQASTKVEFLDYGWIASKQQIDPFDTNKMRSVRISKDNFTFKCNELNFSAPSYGYTSLSISANIKYIIDDNTPIDKQGTFSTYLGGSDLVSDTRYYSFKLSSDDIMSLKKGNLLKIAGKYTTDWLTRELDLNGFTEAYDSMECEKK